nr:DMT family transporter [Sphingomonas solaris]
MRLGAVASFAVMAAAIKLASDRGVSAIELVFARNLFSLPVVATWLTLAPGWRAVRTRRPLAHLSRAGLGLGSMTLNFIALAMLPLADATTIGFSAPLFATILSALVLREKVGRHRWLAVAIGLAGVAVAMRPGGASLPAAGLAIALAGALGTGAVNITLRQIGRTEGVAATVFWFTVISLAVSGLGLPFFAGSHDWQLWALLVLIGVSGGCVQICNTASLRLAPVAVVVPFDYLQLLWAMLFGWVLWATVPGPATLAGGGLIVASGLYTVWRERQLHRSHLPATPTEL